MSYYWIKQLHVATVVFTIGFFAIRLHWMLHSPRRLQRRWVRSLSMWNDILLLTAGILMVLLSGQSPFTTPWLGTKLGLLLLYIVLGSLALKYGRSRRQRTLFGVLALCTVFYIVAVALTRHPLPWSVL